MDLPADHLPQGVVDHPVTIQEGLPLERRGDDDDLEVTAARRGARVPGVPKTAVSPLLGFRSQVESVRSTMGVLRPSELIGRASCRERV